MSDAVATVPAPAPPAGKPSRLAPLIRSLAINLVAPYLLYRLLEGHFPPKSTAPLLISALIPAIEFAVVFARKRAIDVVAIISLAQLSASVLIALLARSVGAAMFGNALQPAVLGLVFGVSLLIGKPILVPLARLTMAGDDPERQARFDVISVLPEARRGYALITLFWFVGETAHTAGLLIAQRVMAAHDYLLLANVSSVAVIGVLTWGSIRYGRAAGRRAIAAGA